MENRHGHGDVDGKQEPFNVKNTHPCIFSQRLNRKRDQPVMTTKRGNVTISKRLESIPGIPGI